MYQASATFWLLFCLCCVAGAQRADGQFWPCNPLNQSDSCAPTPGLPQSSYSVDFTQTKSWPAGWNQSLYTTPIQFTDSGAQIIFGRRGDAPQMMTNFFFLFGKVDVEVQAAPGKGIISSVVLISDAFDEIDWEWSGSSFGKSDLVQTNYFGKGITTGWDRGSYETVASPNTTFHTYSLDWSSERLIWSIDGKTVRTLNRAEAKDVAHQYPQTPCKLQLGLWNAGDPDRKPDDGTLIWAGGYTDLGQAPYTMRVKSVNIQNTNPAYAYNWTDRSGSFSSIKPIQDPKWNVTSAPAPSLPLSSPAAASSSSLNTSLSTTVVMPSSSPSNATTTNSAVITSSRTSLSFASISQSSSNNSFTFFPTNTSTPLSSVLPAGSNYPLSSAPDSTGALAPCVSCASATTTESILPSATTSRPVSTTDQTPSGGFPGSTRTLMPSNPSMIPQIPASVPATPSSDSGPGGFTGESNPLSLSPSQPMGVSSPKGPCGHGAVPPTINNTDLGPNRPPPMPVADDAPKVQGLLVPVVQSGANEGTDQSNISRPEELIGASPGSGADGIAGLLSGATYGSVGAFKDLCSGPRKRAFFYHHEKSNYTIQCNADVPKMDMNILPSKSFRSCIGLCEKHNMKINATACNGVSYMAAAHVCYLKSFSSGLPRSFRHSNRTHCALNMSRKNGTGPVVFPHQYGGLTTRLR